MFSITDKVAVITGAASGIGLETAKHFVAQGARVSIIDICDASAAASKIGANFVRADVSDSTQLQQAFARVANLQGAIDILINNAAIQPLNTAIVDTDDALLAQVLDVNVKGVYYGIKYAAAHMADGGRIINLGSWLGQRTSAGMSSYSASKAAVIHLTRGAAIELGPRRITVNAVCPGLFMTPAMAQESQPVIEYMAPLGRSGDLQELAQLFQYLCSDAAAYITGEAITIDGGMSAGFSQNTMAAVIGGLQSGMAA